MKLFGANKIINEKNFQSDLCTYYVGFDLNDSGEKEYRINDLVKLLLNVIPEFSFGFHEGVTTDNTEMLSKIIESAKMIYKVDAFQKVRDLYLNGDGIDDSVADRYLRRGEFGELILHLLLRDFHKTIPLLSKIYFKDSDGHAVHGFDAVHIQPDTKTLWLGESKLYTDGKAGIKALINDIKEHFVNDYLKSEFAIVSRKVKTSKNALKEDEKEYWLDLMKDTTKLETKLDAINIPLLCTYQSDNFTKYDDEGIQEFIESYETEIKGLKKYFDDNNDHPNKSRLNIILLLFPVQSKKDLVTLLHKNLSNIQSIGDL